MFFRGSRYEAVPEAERREADGRVVRYKRRRVIPSTPAPLGTAVRTGDRPDLVAYRVDLLQMRLELGPRLVQRLQRNAREFELPGGL